MHEWTNEIDPTRPPIARMNEPNKAIALVSVSRELIDINDMDQ
jgi:hypothetical protein